MSKVMAAEIFNLSRNASLFDGIVERYLTNSAAEAT